MHMNSTEGMHVRIVSLFCVALCISNWVGRISRTCIGVMSDITLECFVLV